MYLYAYGSTTEPDRQLALLNRTQLYVQAKHRLSPYNCFKKAGENPHKQPDSCHQASTLRLVVQTPLQTMQKNGHL